MVVEKRKILVFSDWYVPGYKAGGPIRSVSNLVNLMSDEFQFSVITSDTDFGNDVPYDKIVSNSWHEVDKISVNYLGKSGRNIGYIKKLISEKAYDVVYFNSLFSFWYTLVPLVLVKLFFKNISIVIAPRGMLGKGALSLKRKKKALFLRTSRWLRLFNNVLWHATSKFEKDEIIKHYGMSAKTQIAANVPSFKFMSLKREKSPESLRLIFYARISPVKNLHQAIHILSQIKGKGIIEFDIYGPIEDKVYWNQCVSLIEKFNSDILKMDYKGMIDPNELPSVFEKYHFLFLPTLQENYGHAIIEAMSLSTPVIISDGTPWKNLEEFGAGWNLSLENDHKFVTALTRCLRQTQEDYDKMSEKTLDYVKQRINFEELKSSIRPLFLNL